MEKEIEGEREREKTSIITDNTYSFETFDGVLIAGTDT